MTPSSPANPASLLIVDDERWNVIQRDAFEHIGKLLQVATMLEHGEEQRFFCRLPTPGTELVLNLALGRRCWVR